MNQHRERKWIDFREIAKYDLTSRKIEKCEPVIVGKYRLRDKEWEWENRNVPPKKKKDEMYGSTER